MQILPKPGQAAQIKINGGRLGNIVRMVVPNFIPFLLTI